jgi:hypothetical protein
LVEVVEPAVTDEVVGVTEVVSTRGTVVRREGH